MKTLITSNIGSLPRIGEEKDHQRFRRGYGHFERKEISAHAFRDVQQSVIHELIREQENCELDEVTDGLVSWNDPISHFCNHHTGFELAGLTRYFQTNFYYRRPLIVSTPRFKGPLLAREYEFAKTITRKPVRAVLTGPYTLASHTGSTLKSFKKLASRLDFFTSVIAQEVKALVAAGALIIQIDEPSLAAKPEDLRLVQKCLETIAPFKQNAKIILALYFSPLASLWKGLQSLPVDGINVDLTIDGAALFKNMEGAPGQKEIGLGLVDALNTKLESVETLIPLVQRWLEVTPADITRLTPSAGLELLPRGAALGKLAALNKLRNALSQPSPGTLS